MLTMLKITRIINLSVSKDAKLAKILRFGLEGNSVKAHTIEGQKWSKFVQISGRKTSENPYVLALRESLCFGCKGKY